MISSACEFRARMREILAAVINGIKVRSFILKSSRESSYCELPPSENERSARVKPAIYRIISSIEWPRGGAYPSSRRSATVKIPSCAEDSAEYNEREKNTWIKPGIDVITIPKPNTFPKLSEHIDSSETTASHRTRSTTNRT